MKLMPYSRVPLYASLTQSQAGPTCASAEGFKAQARGVMPEHLVLLAAMPRLARLSLKRCRGITDAGLAELAPLTALVDLSLARCYQVGTIVSLGFIKPTDCIDVTTLEN